MKFSINSREGKNVPTPIRKGLLENYAGELKDYQFHEFMTKVISAFLEDRLTEASLSLAKINVKNRNHYWKIRQTIQIIHSLTYRFEQLKSKKSPNSPSLKHIIFLVNKADTSLVKKALAHGTAIGEAMNFTKNLANLPANICTPSYLAQQAKELGKHPHITVSVLNQKAIAALKMGLILSVTQGSHTPAQFITLTYRGTQKKIKPIVLVGKGITFDTGGNTVKVPPNMIGMKYDMCGAATVMGVIKAAAQLKLPLQIIGVIPTCENRMGPNATRPEDVVTSLSGLTVEILNTDAEGRLILADALTYCERFHPDVVIDIATLTGACQLALGPYACGLMSNHEPLAQDLLHAGATSGDRAWQLPLWDEYHEALKSDVADISNVPYSDIGARTLVAGCFLAKFAEKYPWAHLDVANTAANPAGSKRGATGRPVPLLIQYLLDRCHPNY